MLKTILFEDIFNIEDEELLELFDRIQVDTTEDVKGL